MGRNVVGKSREELRENTRIGPETLPLTIKHEDWMKEQEWRILIIQLHGQDRFERLTREDDGVGFFELPICVPEIVTEVILGSRCTSELTAVQSWLGEAGLPAVAVRQSTCECSD